MKIKDVIVLKNGNWEAGVCARLGGNTIYLQYCGKDILRPLTDEEQLAADPYLQGSPILLPANRIYKGLFSFEGVDYVLPITEPRTNSHLHGTVHRQPFEVIEVSDTSVTLRFVNSGNIQYLLRRFFVCVGNLTFAVIGKNAFGPPYLLR